MLLKCTFSLNTSWWLLDTKTPTTTAKTITIAATIITGLQLMFDCFSPLVTSTTFSAGCKCFHSGNLVVTFGCQYYCKTWQNKGTTKATKVICWFYYFGCQCNQDFSKQKHKEQGHQPPGHNNHHVLVNATKVDCYYYFLGVSILQKNDHSWDRDIDVAPHATCGMMHSAMAPMHSTVAPATMPGHKKRHKEQCSGTKTKARQHK